jgi:hypothetical protein
MQIARLLRRLTLPSVACLSLPHFSVLSRKRQDFREKLYLAQNVGFDFLCTFV